MMFWKISILLFTVQAYAQMDCIDLEQGVVSLQEENTKLVVALSNYRCTSCDYEMIRFIKLLKDSFPDLECVILARFGISNIAKSVHKASVEQKYKGVVDRFCFDIQYIESKNHISNDFEDGLFKKLKIRGTPSLLVIKGKEYKIFRYEKLFKDINISKKMKNKVINYLYND